MLTVFEHLRKHRLIENLTRLKVPGLGVKAPLAVQRAARNKD